MKTVCDCDVCPVEDIQGEKIILEEEQRFLINKMDVKTNVVLKLNFCSPQCLSHYLLNNIHTGDSQ
jgi:hypothetical protein